MARAPNEKKKELETLQKMAEKMYKAGIPLVEIAKKLGKPDGTIRRWKSTQNWDGEKLNVRGKKTERSVAKKKKVEDTPDEDKKEEIEDILKKSALDERKLKFCIYYAKTFNATDAYQWAYGCSREAAGVSGCRLLKNPNIQKQVKELKTGELTKAMLEKSDIVEKYIKIAFSDIGSYIEKAENGEVIFRNLKETDTTLIKEIKNTKYGVSIKLEDRSGALKWLAEHYDLMTETESPRKPDE